MFNYNDTELIPSQANGQIIATKIWTYDEIMALRVADLEAMSELSLRKLRDDISIIWNYLLYPVWVKAQFIGDKKAKARHKEDTPTTDKNTNAILAAIVRGGLDPKVVAQLADLLNSKNSVNEKKESGL